MFGHKAGPSIVYEFGCQSPTVGQEIFDEQVRLAHRYRNKLVEIERERRAGVRRVLDETATEQVQQVVDLEAQLELLLAEARQARQRSRSRIAAPDLRVRIVGAKALLKMARAEKKAARLTHLEAVKPLLDEIGAKAAQAVRDARAASGLYWGTYLAVEQGMDRARKGVNDPQFRSFRGDGRIAVQLQGGLLVSAAFGDDSRLQIEPVSPSAWTHPSRGERRRLCRTVVRLRGKSDERQNPIWVECPVSLHRPLPSNGAVKWAYLVRERVGTKDRYKLQLVIELPAATEVALGTGTCALDVGWRLVGKGLRVGYWVDDRGDEGSLVLDAAVLSAFRQVDELQAIRDQNFNTARTALKHWLDRQSGLPDWLTEATATLAQWRSTARLAVLALRWREQRFPTDEEAYERVEAWRKQDKHLLDWQANLRAKTQARRKDTYRCFAADLRRRYETVVLEKFDLRQAARYEQGNGDASELHDASRYQRKVAAISELRGILKHSGLGIREVEAAWTTQTCDRCGQQESFDKAAELIHTCRQCGVSWDQDQCAASNILKRAMGRGT